jgi:hypothetical protein
VTSSRSRPSLPGTRGGRHRAVARVVAPGTTGQDSHDTTDIDNAAAPARRDTPARGPGRCRRYPTHTPRRSTVWQPPARDGEPRQTRMRPWGSRTSSSGKTRSGLPVSWATTRETALKWLEADHAPSVQLDQSSLVSQRASVTPRARGRTQSRAGTWGRTSERRAAPEAISGGLGDLSDRGQTVSLRLSLRVLAGQVPPSDKVTGPVMRADATGRSGAVRRSYPAGGLVTSAACRSSRSRW